jgi:simple sugar transport system ATP-binding protein
MGDYDRQKFVFYMTGREYSNQRLARDVPQTEPVLQVERLCIRNAFTDVSFSLYPGEVLGVTGLLGSGRNELALALSGNRPIFSGQVLLKGKPLALKRVSDAIANGISYVPEDRLTEGTFLDQNIERNVVVSNIGAYCNHIFVIDSQQTFEATEQWIRELGIKTENPFNALNTLSGGNQQKVVLAKSLITQPSVLILNGPTVGVDVGSKMDISRLIQAVAAKGVSVLLISDDSTEILTNCKRILMMKEGRIAAEYRSDDFTESSLYQALVN